MRAPCLFAAAGRFSDTGTGTFYAGRLEERGRPYGKPGLPTPSAPREVQAVDPPASFDRRCSGRQLLVDRGSAERDDLGEARRVAAVECTDVNDHADVVSPPRTMRPKTPDVEPTEDLFRLRLEQMIDPRHELVRLAELIDWSRFEAEFDALFHPSRGAPAVPTRLIVGLHYLEHAFALSDEDVVRRRVENPYWQHFETIEAGRRSGALSENDCARVNVDTTVQEKNVAHPSDGKLVDDARRHLVKLVEKHELTLRQNDNRVARTMRRKIGGYGHAKQYRRMRRQIKLLKTRLGRVVRDIERQLPGQSGATRAAFEHRLSSTSTARSPGAPWRPI